MRFERFSRMNGHHASDTIILKIALLVVEQRSVRLDDQRDPWQEERGYLEDHRLAVACGQQDQRILSNRGVTNRLRLARSECRLAEQPLHDREQRPRIEDHLRSRCRTSYRGP